MGSEKSRGIILKRSYEESQELIRRESFAKHVLKWVGPYTRVLDAGCGDGWLVEKLRNLGHDALGFDLKENAYCRADARAMPFRAGSFDLIAVKGMLDYLRQPRESPLWRKSDALAFLRGCWRALRGPDGILVLMTTNDNSPWVILNRSVGEKYPISRLAGLLDLAGFRVTEVHRTQGTGLNHGILPWIVHEVMRERLVLVMTKKRGL